jgi:hypothetical protein
MHVSWILKKPLTLFFTKVFFLNYLKIKLMVSFTVLYKESL